MHLFGSVTRFSLGNADMPSYKEVMTFSYKIIMVLLATCLALTPITAMLVPGQARSMPLAAAIAANETPLVVIRFNQSRVYFEQPLFTAVSRAVEVKPNVRFNLVSFVPATGDARRDQAMQQQASRNVSRVAQVIREIGIPETNIHVSREWAQGITHDEVHIFVQ